MQRRTPVMSCSVQQGAGQLAGLARRVEYAYGSSQLVATNDDGPWNTS